MVSRKRFHFTYVDIVTDGLVAVGFHCGVFDASLPVFCFRSSLPLTLISSRYPHPSYIAVAYLGPSRLEPIALTLLIRGCRGGQRHSTSLARRRRDQVKERNRPGSEGETNGRKTDGRALTDTVHNGKQPGRGNQRGSRPCKRTPRGGPHGVRGARMMLPRLHRAVGAFRTEAPKSGPPIALTLSRSQPTRHQTKDHLNGNGSSHKDLRHGITVLGRG